MEKKYRDELAAVVSRIGEDGRFILSQLECDENVDIVVDVSPAKGGEGVCISRRCITGRLDVALQKARNKFNRLNGGSDGMNYRVRLISEGLEVELPRELYPHYR